MGLKLQTVAPARGLLWVRQGFAECLRHPMGYASLFVLFMFTALMLTLLSWIGGVLLLMAVPLLSLAFTMATAGAQRGLPVTAAVYLAPWRNVDAKRRRALLLLCLAYALSTLLVLAVCDLIDGGRFDALLALLSRGDASAEEVQKMLDTPGVIDGVIARVVLSSLLSLPFWHAPALVHWGRQGPAQALFSSLVAVWRARGAFALFSLGWMAALMLTGALTSLLLVLLGLGSVAALVMMPMALFFTTAFYASLYFCFVDSFGTAED
jgi:hypothetical protein